MVIGRARLEMGEGHQASGPEHGVGHSAPGSFRGEDDIVYERRASIGHPKAATLKSRTRTQTEERKHKNQEWLSKSRFTSAKEGCVLEDLHS